MKIQSTRENTIIATPLEITITPLPKLKWRISDLKSGIPKFVFVPKWLRHREHQWTAFFIRTYEIGIRRNPYNPNRMRNPTQVNQNQWESSCST